MHAKSWTLTGHGLAMRILLRSLQCAPETKKLNIFLEFHLNCTIAEIHQLRSHYKWFDTIVNLLLKVRERFCGN